MNLKRLNILHCDDDTDDCLFFKEALEELNFSAFHGCVNDGDELMRYLMDENNELPHILFLDLNMPRKSGFECLTEIKINERLRQLTIIILSTSSEPEMLNTLYKGGAHYYIRKPCDFTKFKKIVKQAFIALISQENITQPRKENFVLTV